MSVTGYKLPTGYSQVSGTWTTPQNLYGAGNASITISAKNTTYELDGTNLGFTTTVLPDNAKITAVSLQVNWYESSSSNAILGVQAVVSGTPLTDHTGTRTGSLQQATFDITAERSWVPSDFRDGTLTARCRAEQQNTASSRTYYFDYVQVQVTWDFDLAADGLTNSSPVLGAPAFQCIQPATLTGGSPVLGAPELTENGVNYDLHATGLTVPSANPPGPQCTSYWPAEDSTAPGGGTINGSVTYDTGEFGKGFQFPNSAGNYVALSSSPISQANISGNWSIAAWINDALISNSPGGTGSHCVLYTQTDVSHWIRFGSYNGGKISGEVNRGSGAVGLDSTSAPVSQGTPIHIAATSDGSTLKIFANGTSISGGSATHSSGTSGFYAIGAISATIGWFYGWIDEVRVWDGTCLTDQQVADLAAWSGSGGGISFGTPALTENQEEGHWDLYADGLTVSPVIPIARCLSTTGTVHLHPAFALALLTDTNTHSNPGQSKPDYMASYTDQVFGTTIKRISGDPGSATGISGINWGSDVHIAYFKRMAWNADDSLLFVDTNAEGTGVGALFLNGQTFVPAYTASNKPYEKVWHPTEPDLMIGIPSSSSNQLVHYHPSTNSQEVIKTFTGYSAINMGPWKGSLTCDGNAVVIRGTRTSDSADVCFYYNIAADYKGPDVQTNQWGTTVGHAEISIGGNYILISYSEDDHVAVTDLEGNYIHSTAGGHPTHYDQVRINGVDYMVGRANGSPNGGYIIQVKISDGSQVALTSSGYARMASSRSNNLLCITDMDGTSPYSYSELIAYFADGGDTKAYRIGFAQNVYYDSDYETETMPCISSRGDRVVFSSDWLNSGTGRPVQLYTTELARGLASGHPVLGAPELTPNAASLPDPLNLTGGQPALGVPNLTQVHVFAAPATLSSGQPQFGAPVFTQKHDWQATNLSGGTPALGGPALTQDHEFSAPATLSNSSPTLDMPVFSENGAGENYELEIAQGFLTGSPTVVARPTFSIVGGHVLTALNFSNSAPELGAPDIDQVHVFGAPATLSSGAPALPNFRLGYIFGAPATLSNSAPPIPQPTLVQTCIFSAPATLSSGTPALGAPGLSQDHELQAVNLSGGQPFLGTTQCLIGVVPLDAIGLTNSQPSLGAPQLTQKQVLQPANLTGGQPPIATPVFTQAQVLLPTNLIGGHPVLGAPVFMALGAVGLIGGHPVLGAPIFTSIGAVNLSNSAPTLGSPLLGQKHVLQAINLSGGAPEFASPSLAEEGTILAQNLENGHPVLGAPQLTQKHVLPNATTLTSGAPSLPNFRITYNIVAAALTNSAPQLGAPAITQKQILQAANLSGGAPVLGTTQCLIGVIPLDPVGITNSSPVLGSPALTQKHVVNATAPTYSSPTLGAPAMAQVHIFAAPTTLSSGHPTWTAPAMQRVFTVPGLTGGHPVLGAPTLTQKHVLQAANLTSGSPVLPGVTFWQAGAVEAAGLTGGHPVLGAPELVHNIHMSAESLSNSPPELGAPDMGQNYSFVATALVVAPVLYTVPLVQAHVLTPASLFAHSPVLGAPKFQWNGWFPPSEIVLVDGQASPDTVDVSGFAQIAAVSGRATGATRISGRAGRRQIRNIIR